MTASLDLGDNYQIEENSNGNLVVRDSGGTIVLKHEDGGNFQLGDAGLELGDLIDGSSGATVYDGASETLGDGSQSANLDSLSTADLDINGNDLVESGDFLPIGPSFSLGSRAHAVTTSNSPFNSNLDYNQMQVEWDSLLTSNATPAVRTTLFTSGTSSDKEVRLRNGSDGDNVWDIDLGFGANLITRVDEYTPATTSSNIAIRLEFGTNDGDDIIMRQYCIQFGVKL